MAGYYYILSSLPTLVFGNPPPLSHTDFLRLCTPWLSDRDAARMELARADIENIPTDRISHDMLKKWVFFENTLRNEMVKMRAKNLGCREEEYLRPEMGFDADVIALIPQALKDPSPLQAEMNLLRIRWSFLTEHEVGHAFDLVALMIYGLKLQLLERIRKFDKEKGRQALSLIYERSFREG